MSGWRSDPGPSKTIAERVRFIVDGPAPWIPGSSTAFLEEIAVALEQREAVLALLDEYAARWPKTGHELGWEGLRDEVQAALGINACPYLASGFSHTREWCGFPMCREA